MVAQGALAMDVDTTEKTITAFVQQVRARLDEAAATARAAQACADAGTVKKAVEITLDLEQLLYESNTLLNAMSLIHRLGT